MNVKEKIKIAWGKIFVESFFIVFGVLLALYLNEWRSSMQQEEVNAQALQSIANEIHFNKTVLKQRVEYYKFISDTLETILNDKNDKTANVPGWRGLMPPLLRSSAFEASNSAQIFSRIDFAKSEKISHAYTFQKVFANMLDKIMDKLIENGSFNRQQVFIYTRGLAEVGSELLMAYDGLTSTLPKHNTNLFFK